MIRTSIAALSALTLINGSAFASGLTATQTVETARVYIDTDGQEQVTYELAEEVAPGDEVRYRLTYANASNDAATNVRLDMPVPAQVTLIEGSVEGRSAIVTYSVDNGATYSKRGDLLVSADGTNLPATAEDITNIRWTFADDIAAGSSGEISYRGILQ